MKRYTFTRLWAYVMIAIGIAILVLTVIVAAISAFAGMPTPTLPGVTPAMRLVLGALIVPIGVILAAPFIVTGQLVLVFLDMRTRLQRLDLRSRRLAPRVAAQGRRGGDDSPMSRRLQPR